MIVVTNKNTQAIDKIIAALSFKEFERTNPHPRIHKDGTMSFRPYSLTLEIEEYLKLKEDYLAGVVTEEEYKAVCLKYNIIRA